MDFKSIILMTLSVTVLSGYHQIENTPQDKISKAKMLKLVNEVRKNGYRCGGKKMPPVAPVKWNDKLAKAAYNHSRDMQRNNFFSHTGKNGSNPGQRIKKAGYNWFTYGENVAMGQRSEEAVMKSWLRSKGHCKNIMKKGITHMGVGKSGSYWTQVFAGGE